MEILHVETGDRVEATIEPVSDEDLKLLTVKRYFFKWKLLRDQAQLFKLRLAGDKDIKGVMALVDHPHESRIEIKLLACARENVVLKKEKGKKKKEYDHIAGNLIAHAGRIAVTKYGANACVSLLPKTELKRSYIDRYGMLDGGAQVFLELASLHNILNRYIL